MGEDLKPYKLLMSGRDFHLKWEGRIERMGFYTTICVEATDEESAELKAVEIIRNQNDLKSTLTSVPGYTPKIYLEEICELKSNSDLGTNTGRSFFYEDPKKWWQFWR